MSHAADSLTRVSVTAGLIEGAQDSSFGRQLHRLVGSLEFPDESALRSTSKTVIQQPRTAGLERVRDER